MSLQIQITQLASQVGELEDERDHLKETTACDEAENRALHARVAQLENALARYRYEDCPECMARAEMLADVEPLSPGSKNMIVKPTGWKMVHFDGCTIGALMPANHSAEPNSSSPSVGGEHVEACPMRKNIGVCTCPSEAPQRYPRVCICPRMFDHKQCPEHGDDPPRPAEPVSTLVRCWRCKREVPEETTVCNAGVGTQCKDSKACRGRWYGEHEIAQARIDEIIRANTPAATSKQVLEPRPAEPLHSCTNICGLCREHPRPNEVMQSHRAEGATGAACTGCGDYHTCPFPPRSETPLLDAMRDRVDVLEEVLCEMVALVSNHVPPGQCSDAELDTLAHVDALLKDAVTETGSEVSR